MYFLVLTLQLLYEEVLSHSTLLDTISAKSASIAENYVAQLELQDLQERYNSIKDNAMVGISDRSLGNKVMKKC